MSPVGGVDYPRTFQEFRAWFPDDASCVEYLARLRWPEGFRCPVCDGQDAWRTSTQHWKCVGCGRKTSVTAGTIFHRTRTPLSTWFAAIWLVTSQKNGSSAQNLHDMLGLDSGHRRPRFVRDFLGEGGSVDGAVRAYVAAVRDGSFPGPEHSYR